MKIYTKTGDTGTTGLFGGKRVPKHDARIDAYGTVDELNAQLGVLVALYWEQSNAHAAPAGVDVAKLVQPIQHELFTVGCHLATPYTLDAVPNSLPAVDALSCERLEQQIDTLSEQLPPLTSFILPGGTLLASHIHVARTVCRRAERAIVELSADEPVLPNILQYMNRLSDFLFVLVRAVNHAANLLDTPWKK